MTHHETPRRQRHRCAREDRGSQRCQPEEMLGTFQHGANFRARIAHVFQLLIVGQAFFQFVAQLAGLPRIACDQQPVIDAAAFLLQAGCFEVLRIQQHARSKAGKADGLVDVAHDTGRHHKALLADADLVAHAHFQAAQQPLASPDRAGGGNILFI